MRMFLPIKGPGGRYLTPREKIALLILGVTLILCLLTLLAGDAAYEAEKSRNPVSAFVSLLCRTFGGGIVALYALVLVWSGLIYFKGERAVDMRPLAGRMFAALCVTLGVSGVLGIAHLETAGALGLTVGAAIGNTFGATLGFPILIVLMLLGVHLAGQGAWHAIKEPVRASATGVATGGGLGFGLQDAPQGRFADTPPLPDDGDPSADERTLAVTTAMEEIERSQGVTIVDVEPETETEEEETEDETVEEMDGERPSIGEEVDATPEPHPESEEAQVQRGLAEVESVLDTGYVPEEVPEEVAEDVDVEEEEAEAADEEAYASDHHGFVPVPSAPEAVPDEDDECVEAVFEGHEDEYEEDEDEEEPENGEYLEADEEYEDEDEDVDDEEDADGEYLEADEEEEYEDEDLDEEEVEDDDEEEYEEGEYLEADEDIDDDVDGDEVEEDDDEEEEVESGFAVVEAEDEVEDEPVAEEAPEPEGDPYAQGGLVRRTRELHGARTDEDDRPYTAFDWRGRPLE